MKIKCAHFKNAVKPITSTAFTSFIISPITEYKASKKSFSSKLNALPAPTSII